MLITGNNRDAARPVPLNQDSKPTLSKMIYFSLILLRQKIEHIDLTSFGLYLDRWPRNVDSLMLAGCQL